MTNQIQVPWFSNPLSDVLHMRNMLTVCTVLYVWWWCARSDRHLRYSGTTTIEVGSMDSVMDGLCPLPEYWVSTVGTLYCTILYVYLEKLRSFLCLCLPWGGLRAGTSCQKTCVWFTVPTVDMTSGWVSVTGAWIWPVFLFYSKQQY